MLECTSYGLILLASGGERRDAKTRVDWRREIHVTVIWEKQHHNSWDIDFSNVVHGTKSSFSDVEPISVMNRPDPARPWHSLTAYLSNVLKDTSSKLPHNIVTGLEIAVSYFHREVITFFCEHGFLKVSQTFSRITRELLKIFKIWLSHVKERLKTYKNHYRFHFKIKFYKV